MFGMLWTAPTSAQQKSFSATSSPAWGSETSIVVIPAWAFKEREGLPLQSSGYYRYKPDDKLFVAPFSGIPEGALITAFEIEGCDDSPVGELFILPTFVRVPEGNNGLMSLGFGTGNPDRPGCGLFTHALLNPHLVRNATESYVVMMIGQGSDSLKFSALRVHYQRQISTGPVSATFADVPTSHPLHRFIEALAASGITGGCGGGNYCPDQAVSRGQLAVFLSVALGLHFPN